MRRTGLRGGQNQRKTASGAAGASLPDIASVLNFLNSGCGPACPQLVADLQVIFSLDSLESLVIHILLTTGVGLVFW